MTESLHKATQYLCCAAKSYLDEKPDDSHTNLEWDGKLSALVGRLLGSHQEYCLSLNFKSYSLEFLDLGRELVSSMHLEGANHIAIINWLGEEGVRLELGDLYLYELHYELPYADFDNDFVFPGPDYNELERLSSLRNIAQNSIEHVLNTFEVDADIRIWPHHFDTGAVLALQSETPRSVGLGLAIADSMVEEAYYYVSGWSADNSLILDKMPPLTFGEWKNPLWNGAVLTSDEATEKEAMTFMMQAVQLIRERNELS